MQGPGIGWIIREAMRRAARVSYFFVVTPAQSHHGRFGWGDRDDLRTIEPRDLVLALALGSVWVTPAQSHHGRFGWGDRDDLRTIEPRDLVLVLALGSVWVTPA